MQEGAFVLLDCLGFKGIWKRTKPGLLLQKLSTLGPSIEERLRNLEVVLSPGEDFRFRFHHRLLSDTVVISIQFERQRGTEARDEEQDVLVYCACFLAPMVMRLFVEGEPPLALRGCVTYGEHLIEHNFIVGPAVDEAAEHMNLAEGAFVWLHPEAAARYRRFMESFADLTCLDEESLKEKIKEKVGKHEEAMRGSVLIQYIREKGGRELIEHFLKSIVSFVNIPLVIDPYRMPIKNGGYLECSVINPLIPMMSVNSAEDRRLMMEKYSAIISGNRLDVWIKHQNTMEFLREAFKRLQEFDDSLSARGVDLAQYFSPRQ